MNDHPRRSQRGAKLLTPIGRLLCFASCILVLLLGGKHYHDAHWRALQAQRAAWDGLLRRYLSLVEEKRIIARYYPQFQRAASTVLSAEMHRLNWIERLDKLAAELRIPDLHYELGKPAPWRRGGENLLFSAEMKLRVGILHEAELLALLRGLMSYPHAWSRVSECRLQPAVAAIRMHRRQANINVDCTVQWIGFQETAHEGL